MFLFLKDKSCFQALSENIFTHRKGFSQMNLFVVVDFHT